MTIRRVLYQSVFKAPFKPALPPDPPFGGQREFQDWVEISQHKRQVIAAAVALMQFSAFSGSVLKPFDKPQFTPFDAPRGKVYSAAEQQFTAWHSPFFGTRTPSYLSAPLPFDTPQAPKFNAAEQQFSSWSGFVPPPPVLAPNTPFDAPQTPKAGASEQQFSAFSGTVTTPASTLIAAFTSTPFDAPKAPLYNATLQQFSAYGGTVFPPPPQPFTPFDVAIGKLYPAVEQQFSATTGFVPSTTTLIAAFTSTPFDAPQVRPYGAWQQQFSAFNGLFVGLPPPEFTPFDEPVGKAYPAGEQQFTAWHSPFFGTQTPSSFAAFLPFDTPRAPQYSAAEQQFSAYELFVPSTTTLIAAFTSTSFDAPRAPLYSASLQQFAAYSGTVFPPPPPPFPPLDVALAKPYSAAQQQFSATTGFAPPPPVLAPNTPFDAPRAPIYPAGEQQFTAWHSPFFGTQTPAYMATFVPFDAPRAPQASASQQQFQAFNGTFIAAAQTPNYLSAFYVDTTIPRLTISPALLQFQDLPMGPEQTTAQEIQLGRWGPDETEAERRSRRKKWLYQDELLEHPDTTELNPELPPYGRSAKHPLIPIGEIEPVRKVEPQTLSLERDPPGPGLFAIKPPEVEEDPFDDPEVQELVTMLAQLMATGWRK